jgi:transcriptional regulator with GAF, ATPase, and Fis domain
VSAKDFLREEGPASPGSTSRASSILGTAASIKKVRIQILQVAPTRLAVLITGETGTGKELVARAIHGESPRSQGPLLSVNCAALPGELLEAELFGYRRGAFSGADQDRTGLLPGADGGSFLFDALGDLPLSLQAKLLRVLDRGAVRPLGASEEVEVDVRFLFASNRELRSLVNEGRFRQDLFYRLSTFEIRLPPLRERVGDVPLLLSHFQEQAKGERQTFRFDPGALEFLVSYPWPGNVRELENLVRRLALTAEGKIGAEEVRGLLSGARAAGPFPPEVLRGSTLPELQDLLERSYLIQLHADCGGDLRAMARALGIKRRALYKRFTRLGIKPGDLEGR